MSVNRYRVEFFDRKRFASTCYTHATTSEHAIANALSDIDDKEDRYAERGEPPFTYTRAVATIIPEATGE